MGLKGDSGDALLDQPHLNCKNYKSRGNSEMHIHINPYFRKNRVCQKMYLEYSLQRNWFLSSILI